MATPSPASEGVQPRPHPVSGVIDCPAELTYRDLVEAAERSGFCADGLQPEEAGATLGELLERRQPRPVIWSAGLLPERCVRLVASRAGTSGYVSVRAPRKASGPDWAYLFTGAEGAHGRIVEVSISLLRPPDHYLLLETTFDTVAELFDAARRLVLWSPTSTRRLDWGERRLAAAVPVRFGEAVALTERLSGLAGSTEARLESITGVPGELRYLPATRHEGPLLVVSAPYDRVVDLVTRVAEAGGDAAPEVWLRYADAHGLEATVGLATGDSSALDATWEAIERVGLGIHDARRRDDAGRWHGLAHEVGA